MHGTFLRRREGAQRLSPAYLVSLPCCCELFGALPGIWDGVALALQFTSADDVSGVLLPFQHSVVYFVWPAVRFDQ